MTIRIYTSKNCPPCVELEQHVKEGKFEGDIELIDIESDEGFEKFKREVLNFGDGAVPSAYKDGRRCIISISEEDKLTFNCPSEDSSSV